LINTTFWYWLTQHFGIG